MYKNSVSVDVKCPYCNYRCKGNNIIGIGTQSGTLVIECSECGKEILIIETVEIKVVGVKIKEGE